MPIVASDLVFRLTGGASNTDPNASLGGVMSSTAVGTGLHNLFDKVTGAESAAGDTEYRCLAVLNNHATLTWESVKAYISASAGLGSSQITIGFEKPATNAVQTVANESTAPTGISFSAPTTYAGGIECTGEGATAGTVPATKWFGVWVKRVVAAGTGAKNDNSVTISVDGDTPE